MHRVDIENCKDSTHIDENCSVSGGKNSVHIAKKMIFSTRLENP